jgi:hypothetical protein
MTEPNVTSIANVSPVAHASRPMHHSRIEIHTTSAPEIHPRGDADPAYIDVSRLPPSVVDPDGITPDRNSTSNRNITVIAPPPEWPGGFYPPFPNFTFPSFGNVTAHDDGSGLRIGLGVGLGLGIPAVLIAAGFLVVRCLRGSSGTRTAQEARPAAAASPGKVDKKGPGNENAAAAQAPVEIEMDRFDRDLEGQPVAQALALGGHDNDREGLLAA